MSTVFNKITNMRYFKQIYIFVLFLFASYFTYRAVYNFVPVVTSQGRGILNTLPNLLCMGVPLFTLICSLIYFGVYNVASKYKVIKVYGYTLFTTQAVAFIIHVIMIVKEYKGFKGVVTPGFPYDLLVFIILFLVLSIGIVAWTIKNRQLAHVYKTSTIVVKKRRFVAMSFAVSFACYFAGVFMASFNLIGPVADPNWWAMIPVILAMLLMGEGLGLYYWYYTKKSDPEQAKKTYRIALFIYALSIFTLYIWIVIALTINHFFMHQSLSGLFVMGYAMKMPAGVIINYIGAFILLVVAGVKYYLRYLKVNKNK